MSHDHNIHQEIISDESEPNEIQENTNSSAEKNSVDNNDLNDLILYTQDPITKNNIPSMLKKIKTVDIYATTLNSKNFIEISKKIFDNEELRNCIHCLIQLPNNSNELYIETSNISLVKKHFRFSSFGKVGQTVIITNFCNYTLWHPLNFSDNRYYGILNKAPYKNEPCRILDIDYKHRKCLVLVNTLESHLDAIQKSKLIPNKNFKASFDGKLVTTGILYKGNKFVGSNTLLEINTKSIITWSANISEEDLRKLNFDIELHQKNDIFDTKEKTDNEENEAEEEEDIDNNDSSEIVEVNPKSNTTKTHSNDKKEQNKENESGDEEIQIIDNDNKEHAQYLAQLLSKESTKEKIDLLWADYRSICSKQLYPIALEYNDISVLEFHKLIRKYQNNIEILNERSGRFDRLAYVLRKLSTSTEREISENCRKLKPKLFQQIRNNKIMLNKNKNTIEDLKKKMSAKSDEESKSDNEPKSDEDKSDSLDTSNYEDASESQLVARLRQLEKEHRELLLCQELSICDLAHLPSGQPVLVIDVKGDQCEVLTTTNVKIKIPMKSLRKEYSDGSVSDKRGIRILPRDPCMADGIEGEVSVVSTSLGNAFCEVYSSKGISYICRHGASLYNLQKRF